MLGVTVQGGTSAGTRRVRQHDRWWCDCTYDCGCGDCESGLAAVPKTMPGSRYSCPDCGARRPS